MLLVVLLCEPTEKSQFHVVSLAVYPAGLNTVTDPLRFVSLYLPRLSRGANQNVNEPGLNPLRRIWALLNVPI